MLDLRFESEEGMIRSVGEWPNGVLIVDLSNPCEPSFAIDWHFDPPPVKEKKPGEHVVIKIEEEHEESKERVTLEQVVSGCKSLDEAMVVWTIALQMLITLTEQSARDPQRYHELWHVMKFVDQLHDALGEESDHRGENGERTEL